MNIFDMMDVMTQNAWILFKKAGNFLGHDSVT